MKHILDDLPNATEQRADKQRIAEQARLLDQLGGTINELSRAQFRLRLPPPPKQQRGGFLRVIAGDLHGQHMDPAAFAAFVRDVASIKPAEIVLLGDWIDCAGWLSEHPTLHMPETTGSFADDVAAGNQTLDAIQHAAPGSRVYYLEGNHEWRVIKTILKMTRGHKTDAIWLMNLIGLKRLLNLDERRITFVRHDEMMPGVKVRGTLRLGDWYFTHGAFRRGGANAVRGNLGALKRNFCQGHVHRRTHVTQQSADQQEIHGHCFGCLCQFQPYYMENATTDWAHGYGLQMVNKDGTATTWSVPIEDGVSGLAGLKKTIKGAS